ncbi:MAG: YeeE/YedE family protein [Bacteroidales bacterium]|nr:YeeE/YedE family protein [Bacteroidales bacterium]
MKYIVHLILGIIFGIILVKSEVVSWFRIQEMFRFQSFHMYGIISSAVAVGAFSVLLIKKFNIKTFSGEIINLDPKPLMRVANITGGFFFGLGWAFTGACPGPIYSLIGCGIWIFIIVLISAYIRTLAYGVIRKKLPH